MKAAIVIPVFNRREVTLRFLDSFHAGKNSLFTVILVDSGSTDGTPAAIRGKYPDAVLLETTQDSWWAAATNIGVKQALKNGCDFIITCNDDNHVSVTSLEQLVDTAIEQPHSIVAATVCYYGNPDSILFAGRKRSTVTDRFFYIDNGRSYSELDREVREADLLHGMCTLFPAGVFRDVGYFDERAFPQLFADDDLALRARKAGYRLLVDTRSVILNDHTETGLNPYHSRPGPVSIIRLFISRKSAFQVSTRTRFLWRHRRSVMSFLLTWVSDYCRLLLVIMARWILPDRYFSKIARCYLRIATR